VLAEEGDRAFPRRLRVFLVEDLRPVVVRERVLGARVQEELVVLPGG
jgi:hypothetical protein